ncbi:MAG TPA: hypothetical protein VJU59_41980 [Paraburkholderia sp.]|uniref:hypothetical protein n=1 Tax=Paraburkholderia sp. TaxID=1926495 RepID=UPI002B4981A2|nr:hypothetical protein [Paraburkholderia sp.]HKR46163.1 hypothetical protein [Paraburkholderia sp.]
MKIKPIAAAVSSALALTAVAGPASAAFFEPWTVAGTETHTLRLSGATAQDKGIVLLMRRICSTGTMTRIQGTVDSAMLCEANGADSAPIAAGTKLVLYKNSNGGSSRGVNPVADQTTVTFLNLASLSQVQYQNTSVCTLTTFASTADFADYKEYACGASATTSNLAPDAGISDVEPSLLGWVTGVNGAFGAGYPSAGPGLLFGVPVSKNFRDALQTAQAATLTPRGCVVGSDTEECMPSLTKAQIASIYNGGIVPIARLSSDSGSAISTPTGATTISVCRRKEGSGTLASYRAYFLNEGCVKTAQAVKGFVAANADGNAVLPSVAARVNEYSATPQVIGCLNANHGAGKYAIGMASMETKVGSAYLNTGLAAPFDDDTGNWAWIKIQGYAPTLLNAAQSRYDFLMELSYQGKGALAGDPKTLFDKLISTNSTATVIKELNTQFTHSNYQSGFLGRPSSGSSTLPTAAPAGALTAAEVTANPVNTWTRAANGTPNSCQPAFLSSRETGTDMLQ